MNTLRGREGKKISPSVRKDDVSIERLFYALRSRGENPDEKKRDDDVGKFSLFC